MKTNVHYDIDGNVAGLTFTDKCERCAASVAPTEIERDPAGWFAVYDHCGVTWTIGFNPDGSR